MQKKKNPVKNKNIKITAKKEISDFSFTTQIDQDTHKSHCQSWSSLQDTLGEEKE